MYDSMRFSNKLFRHFVVEQAFPILVFSHIALIENSLRYKSLTDHFGIEVIPELEELRAYFVPLNVNSYCLSLAQLPLVRPNQMLVLIRLICMLRLAALPLFVHLEQIPVYRLACRNPETWK